MSSSVNPPGFGLVPVKMHPLERWVRCMLRSMQARARTSDPSVLLDIVSSLWSSHQSMFGLPVFPAVLITNSGFVLSSVSSTVFLLVMSVVVNSALRYFLYLCPIHPAPKTRIFCIIVIFHENCL